MIYGHRFSPILISSHLRWMRRMITYSRSFSSVVCRCLIRSWNVSSNRTLDSYSAFKVSPLILITRGNKESVKFDQFKGYQMHHIMRIKFQLAGNEKQEILTIYISWRSMCHTATSLNKETKCRSKDALITCSFIEQCHFHHLILRFHRLKLELGQYENFYLPTIEHRIID